MGPRYWQGLRSKSLQVSSLLAKTNLVTKTRLLPSLVTKFLISLMAKIEQVLDLNLHLKRFQFRYMFKDM